LPLPSRTGDQDDAIAAFDDLIEQRDVGLVETELGFREQHVAAAEDAHDDLFAMDRRQDRDAQVDVLALNGHFDATVLGQAFLGNVEPAHDLDAGNDGRMGGR